MRNSIGIPICLMHNDTNHLDVFKKLGLLQENKKVRLHLGCGSKHFDGYINIDFPPEQHNIINVKADFFVDIRLLLFPPESVDEIRLHHVFEHFGRVEALSLIIKWHSWLKVGGLLRIETPDIIGSAKTLLSAATWDIKMGTIRHLAGDQTAAWGYHVDHWSEDRFRHTLRNLGFAPIATTTHSWKHKPFLSNVEVFATKEKNISLAEQLVRSCKLLFESVVSPEDEIPTYKIWVSQLRKIFGLK